ncbi:MAG TPA: hypothetical protein VMZ28_15235, partial [Kofleriaceae bacterium]|nr:hypothetical protein [Kofleriaceae bacterium]
EGLAAIAPTVLVGESVTGKIPLWTAAPDGWQRTDLGGAPNVTLQRYRPLQQSDHLTDITVLDDSV